MTASTTVRPPLRVCVCTSYEAAVEPRAPRHASTLAGLGAGVEVVFVDALPANTDRRPVKALEGLPNLEWQTRTFSTRDAQPLRRLLGLLVQRVAETAFRSTGRLLPAALSTKALGLEAQLHRVHADIYVSHNIDTLLPAWIAARRNNALLIFDSMEYHADMGDSQTPLDRALAHAVQSRCLRDCALVLASSDCLADALAEEYVLPRPLPLYNAPPVEATLPAKGGDRLLLYWRNSVVGFGQRGLDDALEALGQLPVDVILSIQGRLPQDGGAALRARIGELGLGGRVDLLSPHVPEDAVRAASPHHIGLCLERDGVRNHRLTVSNKLFDYHMAGLASVVSDLPSLSRVVAQSGGGVTFRAGSARDLGKRIADLRRDPGLLHRLARAARSFALLTGNQETQMRTFVTALAEVCRCRFGVDLPIPDAPMSGERVN
jgi:glycosyltransferase involved in cell wall biosynthesis